MDDERQLLSSLSEGGQQCVAVPGLPRIFIWDIHRSQLGSMKLDAQESSAPLFQSMVLSGLCPFHCVLVEDTVSLQYVIPRECPRLPRVRISLP